jgi:uncharacterized membrane protein YsdA (DUF1294 family)
MSDIVDSETKNGYLTIPIRQEQIGSFVLSLLGQPQSIEREVAGAFIVKHEWLLNLLYLINQRITQQNESTLVSFLFSITYTNEEKRTLHSIQEFEHFNETKKLYTKDIRIKMSYIVKFPLKELPEKQNISLFITTDGMLEDTKKKTIGKIVNINTGVIRYQIEGAERTWTDDIDQLFDRELANIYSKNGIWHIITNVLLLIGLYFGSIASLFSNIILHEIAVNKKKEALLNSIKENIVSFTNDDKINYIFSVYTADLDKTGMNIVSAIISLVASVFVVVFGSFLLLTKKQSYLLITDKDSAIYEKKRKRRLLKCSLWIIGFLVSIIGGVLSNYVFNFLVK